MRKSEKVFGQIKDRLHSNAFLLRHRAKRNYFCRDRKLNFATVIITLINRLTKSLNVEISKFMLNFKQGELATKQAFSQARYKLKPEAFTELNETFVQAYYSEGTHRLYAQRYLLLAVDGSNYELPWFDDIVEGFGCADNTQGGQAKAMARGVKVWDLLNEVSVAAVLGRYDESETAIFDSMWPGVARSVSGSQEGQVLFVGDAYFPGMARMVRLLEGGVDFIIRCKPTHCREVVEFMEGTSYDAVLDIDLTSDRNRRTWLRKKGLKDPPDRIRLRAVRLEMEDGTEGCVLCSVLSEDDLNEDEIRDIYSLRYGEEVSFYMEKFRAQCENFATKLAVGVRQEWHANILCLNMTQLLIEEAQKELDLEQQKNPKKYYYKINKSAAIGLVKDEIPKVLFGQEDITEFNRRMIKLIFKFREPVRPERSNPRKTKHRLKYNMNQRKIL